MKGNLKALIKVILMLGVCAAGITICIKHNKPVAHLSVPPPVEPDTIVSPPEFFSKTPEEGLKEALDYYEVIYPHIVYAQAVLETGNFTSKVCKEKNNLFGLYNSRKHEYYSFNHWTESVVAYKEWIQKRYRDGEDYYDFLNRISYAEESSYTLYLKKIVK